MREARPVRKARPGEVFLTVLVLFALRVLTDQDRPPAQLAWLLGAVPCAVGMAAVAVLWNGWVDRRREGRGSPREIWLVLPGLFLAVSVVFGAVAVVVLPNTSPS